MPKVPENVGCDNKICIKKDECKRNEIAKNGKAVAIKTFGGTEEKGCGKFIQK